MNEGGRDDAVTPEILQAIEGDITQRRLAARLGVVLYMAKDLVTRYRAANQDCT